MVQSSAAPDLILVGGRVYTLDAARPWAEAVALRGDRIVGAGTSPEMRQAAGASTRVIDLNGAFVTPGFNDGHVHVESTGALLTDANLLDVHEPEAFRERIAQAASRLPAGSRISPCSTRTSSRRDAPNRRNCSKRVCHTRSPEARWYASGSN